MNPNAVTASRIKQLRESKKLSQFEFCEKFSEFMNRPTVYSVMTISCWETGRKLPPADLIMQLALFYGVSTDYIYGLTNDGGEIYKGNNYEGIKKDIEIPFGQLSSHDKEPVFVQFPDMKYKNQWGILDFPNSLIVFSTFKMQINRVCTYFKATPPEEITIKSQANYLLNLKDMVILDRVYVQSLSPDPYMQGKISGWYRNDKENNFLINEKGFTLSYEGLGEAYNAIDFKTTKKRKENK